MILRTHDGVNICDERVRGWIKEGIENLQSDYSDDRQHTFRSGNRFVVIKRISADEDDEEDFFEVLICRIEESMEGLADNILTKVEKNEV